MSAEAILEGVFKNTFAPNSVYIDLLRRHSVLTKNTNHKNDKEWNDVQKKLLKIEKEISSEEILQNTKLAFPHSINL